MTTQRASLEQALDDAFLALLDDRLTPAARRVIEDQVVRLTGALHHLGNEGEPTP